MNLELNASEARFLLSQIELEKMRVQRILDKNKNEIQQSKLDSLNSLESRIRALFHQ